MVQRKGAITVAMRSLQSQSRETTRVEPFPEAFVVFAGNPQLSDRLFDLKLPVDNDADHHIVGRVFNEAASPTGGRYHLQMPTRACVCPGGNRSFAAHR